MLFHIVLPADWQAQAGGDFFEPASFATEGFIHLCTDTQIDGVIERYYSEHAALIILHLDADKLKPELKWEPGPTGELFPHLYGLLDQEDITAVTSRTK